MTLDTTSLAVMSRRPNRRYRIRIPALVASMWLAIIVISVVAAPLLAPGGPIAQDLGARMALPSSAHLLGTDALGRDILARILYGGQVTLVGVFLGTLTALVIGVPMGLAAGYFGRWVDRVCSFISDLLMAVPVLLVILLGFAIFPNSSLMSMLIFGLFTSAPIFRVVRGATLAISDELYVVAARAGGLTHLQVIVRHIAPRLGGLIQVQGSVIAAIALATQVGLGFLGLDVAPPAPSWGGMIANAAQGLLISIWPIVPPTLVIVFTIVALGVLGDLGQEKTSARSTVSLRSSRVRVEPAAAGQGERPTPVAEEGVLLQVEELSVSVTSEDGDCITLVNGVSFDVRAGEVVGLVGESGAGKSVTARSLLRLNGATETTGTARFEGIDLLRISDRALGRVRGTGIGYIGQDPMSSLDPLFRIESQLIEAVRTHHGGTRAAARRRALELLDDVRIPDPAIVARRFPFELSGGMAQRVSIALALAGDPRLLIADEPTTALDVTVQMEVLGLLQRLREERGLAIILVTHDWGVVADICDRALTMHAGEVVERGTLEELFAEPREIYISTGSTTRDPAPAHEAESPLLAVEDLSVEYRRGRKVFKAVDSISFEIPRGRTVGLVGESGSGKTTIGRAIQGLVKPSAGRVILDGEDITMHEGSQRRRISREIQTVFQDPFGSLNPVRTIGATLSEPLMVHEPGLSRREITARIHTELDLVGLPSSAADRYPVEFSGGQRQRIAIARALICRPSLVICDEAVSALDISIQAQVLGLLADIQGERGVSYLFITHDLTVVRNFAQKVLVLERGGLADQFEAEEMETATLSSYTRRLFEAAPVPDPVRQREKREAFEQLAH